MRSASEFYWSFMYQAAGEISDLSSDEMSTAPAYAANRMTAETGDEMIVQCLS